jgi:mono/diheme cytochrome c family protein
MLASVLMAGMAVPCVPAMAQDYRPDPNLAALGESIWKSTAPCRNCHGGLANGIGDVPQDPQGPNLRETTLQPAEIAEVIRCGRPGTEMPHFDARAYTDRRCYDVTAAELGDAVPPAGSSLSPRQIDAIVALLVTRFVGKPDPTYEECVAFWGEGATTCGRYPKAN